MAASRPCVVELLVMLAQEILAVIVAIWRAHHGVDVITRRLLIAERNAALMMVPQLGNHAAALISPNSRLILAQESPASLLT